jgi:hypothetical protein
VYAHNILSQIHVHHYHRRHYQYHRRHRHHHVSIPLTAPDPYFEITEHAHINVAPHTVSDYLILVKRSKT